MARGCHGFKCEGDGRIAIKPVYTYDPKDGSDLVFSLTDEDFDKIQKGYGCPRCLEDFNGVFLTVCPVCSHKADLADFQDWKRYPWMRVAEQSLARDVD